VGMANPVSVTDLRARWHRPGIAAVVLSGLLATLSACGAPAPAGKPDVAGAGSTGTSSTVPASPSSCGRVVVGGAAAVPMPQSAAGCLASALTACSAGRLVVVQQGVDALRTDTLVVLPGEAPCSVTVTEDFKVVPRPPTSTVFTCRRAEPAPGALTLTDCSDATTHTFPSQA
jgi:hypothetical protein